MTDREALFRGILENPDDDTLRLIYADALDEESDARRAAFVRAQVRFARLPEYDPARVRARHHDPDRHLVAEWVGGLPDLPAGLRWDREPCRRGRPQPRVPATHRPQLPDRPARGRRAGAGGRPDPTDQPAAAGVTRPVRKPPDRGTGRAAPVGAGDRRGRGPRPERQQPRRG